MSRRRTLITTVLLLIALVLLVRWAHRGPGRWAYEAVAGWLNQARVQVVLEQPSASSGDWNPDPRLEALWEHTTSAEQLAGLLPAPDEHTPELADVAEVRASLSRERVLGPLSGTVIGWRLRYSDTNPTRAPLVLQDVANHMVTTDLGWNTRAMRDRLDDRRKRLQALLRPDSNATPSEIEAARLEQLRAAIASDRARRQLGPMLRVAEAASWPDGLGLAAYLLRKLVLPPARFETQALLVLAPAVVRLEPGPGAESPKARLDRLALLVTSRPVLSRQIDELELYRERSERDIREVVIDHMVRQLSIEALPDGPGLELAFRDPSSETARAVAVALADGLVEMHRRDRDDAARKSLEFWNAELGRITDPTPRAHLEARVERARSQHDLRLDGGGETLRRLPAPR